VSLYAWTVRRDADRILSWITNLLDWISWITSCTYCLKETSFWECACCTMIYSIITIDTSTISHLVSCTCWCLKKTTQRQSSTWACRSIVNELRCWISDCSTIHTFCQYKSTDNILSIVASTGNTYMSDCSIDQCCICKERWVSPKPSLISSQRIKSSIWIHVMIKDSF